MTSPAPGSTPGATAATPRRRRPVWAWILLALVAIAIVIAILLLTGRCGSGSTAGAPPASPPVGAPAGAPGAAPGAGAPGAPGAPGTPGAGGAGGAGTAPGAPGGAPTDPAALQSRIDEIVAAQPITFRPNSAELTDAGSESLDRVAQELTAAPSARVTVTGYSAPLGGAGTPDPQQLSDQRATTVADELAADGVARDRLQTRGASDTEPRPDPASSRRAEIAVS
ncbi:OmpA family protein [Actinomycetospora sp. CA-101289]|uniref:OmpA family protein n=1 Tax=Actinomycetospora sp. CA-101289 TaxID=3239893 RepID=UPI003D960682